MVSAQFLIDSESKLSEATAKMLEAMDLQHQAAEHELMQHQEILPANELKPVEMNHPDHPMESNND